MSYWILHWSYLIGLFVLKDIDVMKIIIADDSSVVQERLAKLLSNISGQCEILQTGNAFTAIRMVEDLSTDDVVILDIKMPGGGMSALEEIKKEPKSPTVIMYTNYPYSPLEKRCFDLGADYFFDKSTDMKQMADLLKDLIHDAEKQIENDQQ